MIREQIRNALIAEEQCVFTALLSLVTDVDGDRAKLQSELNNLVTEKRVRREGTASTAIYSIDQWPNPPRVWQPKPQKPPPRPEIVTPDWIVLRVESGGVALIGKDTNVGVRLDAETIAAIVEASK